MKTKRQIIRIDAEKCNGCGNCVTGCHEGALQIIDGKARLISDLLCDGLGGSPRADAPEAAAWSDWAGPRLSLKRILGEGLMAAAAWQCVAACDAVAGGRSAAANVSLVGGSQQSIGARFVRGAPHSSAA